MTQAERSRKRDRRLHLQTSRIWWPRWRRRAFFLAGGLVVGGLAVGMALLADRAQDLFGAVHERWPALQFVLTPLGFSLAAWITRRFFPNASGSGIPQVIAAHALADPDARVRLVSLRAAFGQVLLLLLGLACGASSGREGPTVQVGASIMFALGRLAPHRQPGLLIAGSAAGVAAASSAPLAGIIFGIEEMSRSFEQRTSGLILGTVIAAGLTSLAILGDYAYFGTTNETIPFGPQWLAVPVAGIVGGLAAGLFSRALIAMARRTGSGGTFHQDLSGRVRRHLRTWRGAVRRRDRGSVFGTGYAQAKSILHGGTPLPASFGPFKLVATVLSSISGIPGGIFSPSLAVGAGIAQDLASVCPAFPWACSLSCAWRPISAASSRPR